MDNYTAVGEVNEYSVIQCNRNEVSKFIEKWHYSKNVNGLTVTYCFKLLDKSGVLIGAIIYGKIAMANVWKKYSKIENELIELKRLCCIDNTPKNTESYFIAKTLKWIKKNTIVKKIISYADTFYNHTGTIYKASNFLLIGKTNIGKKIYYKGRFYHDKTVRTKYNGELKPFAKKIQLALIEGCAKYVNTGYKNIYIYNLRK